MWYIQWLPDLHPIVEDACHTAVDTHMITIELLPKYLDADIILNALYCSLFRPWQQSDPSLLILEIPEEQIQDEITMEIAIAERIRAGKKRAKKIKQRVAVR